MLGYILTKTTLKTLNSYTYYVLKCICLDRGGGGQGQQGYQTHTHGGGPASRS